MKLSRICFALIFLFLLGLNKPFSLFAYTTNQAASVVVGQPDFSSSSVNYGSSVSEYGFDSPRTAIIAEGKLITLEDTNNRVLVWNTVPTTNGVPADVVIGQTLMTESTSGPCQAGGKNMSIADSGLLYVNGKLFIVDSAHHRILVYNAIPTTNGASADYAIGQPNLTTCTSGTTQSTLNTPTAIASDGIKLAITDTTNNRVLIYNTIPTTSGASADVVVGQSGFLSSSAGTTQATMNNPRGVALYNNKLIIGERGNFRVTIFNSIPGTNGVGADVVLGQTDFVSAITSPPSTASTVHPFFLHVDPLGRLYVADRSSSRYLIWNSIPTVSNSPADVVIGQPDFTSTTPNNGGVTATSVGLAKGIFATSLQMVVADQANNRVLIFNNPSEQSSSSSPVSSSGQTSPTAQSCTNQKPSSSPDLFQINTAENNVELFFTPVLSNTDRYYISYSAQSHAEENGLEVITNSNGVISVSIKELKPITTYYFKVRAGNGCQPGDWSAVVSAKTKHRASATIFENQSNDSLESVYVETNDKDHSNTTANITNENSTIINELDTENNKIDLPEGKSVLPVLNKYIFGTILAFILTLFSTVLFFKKKHQ